MATIATHKGNRVNRAHNRREARCVEKEPHIQKNGHFEIWVDEDPREAYKKLFDKHVEDYNALQTKKSRRISNYYDKVKKDKQKNIAYEMIVGVYPKDGDPDMDPRQILSEYIDGWQEANPNLYLLGCYFHADEEGSAPHLHVDFIPVATYDKGQRCRTALSRALEQQGCKSINHRETALIAWEHRENARLEGICNEHGIQVEHPDAGKGVKHLSTQAYKAKKDLDKLKDRLAKTAEEALEHGYINKAEDVIKLIEEIDKER